METRLTSVIVFVLICIFSKPLAAQTGTMTDTRDGKTYKTVQVGAQVWMAENLAYAPTITLTREHQTFDDFYRKDSSYYFCYADDKNNLKKYGALYSWETAMHSCPSGWHLPTEDEFKALFNAAGKDKKTSYLSLIAGGNSGFNGILSGELYNYSGTPKFSYEGVYTFFWTSTKVGCCDRMRAGLWGGGQKVLLNKSIQVDAYSVRCLKDEEK